MKKTILIIAILGMLLPSIVRAQPDTVQWGYNKYHYSVWYDTLPEFYDTSGRQLWLQGTGGGPYHVLGVPQYVERPTLVYGVAVTERMPSSSLSSLCQNPWHTEEYVYLFQKVGDTLVLRDSVRWDTITPKVMKLAMNADTQRYGFERVRVYEALFKDPVLVDSVFYTVSTNNGEDVPCGSAYYAYVYLPVELVCVFNGGMLHYPQWCPKPQWWQLKVWNVQTREWIEWEDWNGRPANSPMFGIHFPIVDYVELIVTSADTAMGTAGPVAHVARNTSQTIYATPKRGYRFSHWMEDWGIHATRSVYIAQDTTRFTAVFEPKERYRVDGLSDDESAGHVEVYDSVYYEGDTAVLEAFAASGMKFRYWSNGSTENPLHIVVEGDTTVTAHFSPLELYRVEGVSYDTVKGYVVGDSLAYEDDTATLVAIPTSARYVFSSWSTGDTTNPLRIVVVSDTVVMAFFAGSNVGVASVGNEGSSFTLSPNPARGQVTVTLSEDFRGSTLRMQDAAGREVLRRELPRQTQACTFRVADYPSGTYFVTLTTAKGTSTQKLVVEN